MYSVIMQIVFALCILILQKNLQVKGFLLQDSLG